MTRPVRDEAGREADRPAFGHLSDLWVYERNVREGKPLCERCRGGGNELYAMYRACSDCSGSGVDRSKLPPPPPEPEPWKLVDSEPLSVGGACVAPSWPEWAATEEGDIVWVRLDLEARASEVADAALDSGNFALERRDRQAMYLERERTEWSDDWLICTAVLEDDPQDAAVYVRFDVVEYFPPVEDPASEGVPS